MVQFWHFSKYKNCHKIEISSNLQNICYQKDQNTGFVQHWLNQIQGLFQEFSRAIIETRGHGHLCLAAYDVIRIHNRGIDELQTIQFSNSSAYHKSAISQKI